MAKRTAGVVSQGTKHALWAKLIDQWRVSGVTQREFCARRGLAVSTFQWWRRRVTAAAPRPDAVRASFVALPVTPPQLPTSVVEVELRSGTRLRFEGEAARVAVDVLVARVR